jgi:hypothetical protein
MGAWDDGGGYSVSQSQSYKIVPLKDRAAGAEEKLAFRYVLKGPDGERVVSLLSPFIEFKNAGLDVRYTIAPTLSVVAEAFGYRVSWPSVTNATYPNYIYTEIYESKTLSNFTVAQLTNAAVVSKGNSQANSISIAADLVKRYVRVRHVGYSNGQLVYTPLSNVVEVTPTDPVAAAIDSVPPAEATGVTAVWSGDNISISATVAADSKRFVIKLTNGSNTGYFNKYPSGQSTSQTIIITKQELYDTFGQYFTSFNGIFQAADFADNLNSGTAFTVGSKANALATVTPSITVTAITNGYTVTWVMPADAYRAQVHEGSLSTFVPSSGNMVYSGTSPAIVKKLVYDQVYVKVVYYDIYGNASLVSSAVAVTPINSISADIQAPAAPSSVSATAALDSSGTVGFNGYLNISWSQVSDSTLRGYRIRFRPVTNPGSEYSYVDSPGTATTYRLAGLAVGATYEIAVAAYDEFNNTTASYTAISPNVTIAGAPFIGTNVSTTGYFEAGVSGTDTGTFKFGYGVATGKRGLVFNTNNYWYIDSAQSALFKIGGASDNYVSWNGTKLQVDGDLGVAGGTTIGGNIAMGASGASIYQGTLNGSGNLTSDGFLLNSGGLTIKKGSVNLQLNTSDGGIYADYGRIAGWTIDSTKFEKLVSSNYTGVSTGGTYAFYAGSASSGGDVNAQFYVTPAGYVQAKNINISGGSLTIGSKFSVASSDGKLTASGADITGEIKADTGRIGQVTIGSNSLYVGANVSSGNRIVLNSGGLAAYSGSESSPRFELTSSGTASIAGWTINSSSMSSAGTYPLVLDAANARLIFNNGATGAFTLDQDSETVTTYTLVGYTNDGGESDDTWFSRYYSAWTPVYNTTLTEENSISLKRVSASGAQPSITLSTASTGFARLKNVSSASGSPSSEILLADGGIRLYASEPGGYKIENLSSGAHYTYNGIANYTYAEIGTSIVIKSDGTLSTGRAFYKSAGTESSITNSSGSVWPQVGRIGDIIFSTSD